MLEGPKPTPGQAAARGRILDQLTASLNRLDGALMERDQTKVLPDQTLLFRAFVEDFRHNTGASESGQKNQLGLHGTVVSHSDVSEDPVYQGIPEHELIIADIFKKISELEQVTPTHDRPELDKLKAHFNDLRQQLTPRHYIQDLTFQVGQFAPKDVEERTQVDLTEANLFANDQLRERIEAWVDTNHEASPTFSIGVTTPLEVFERYKRAHKIRDFVPGIELTEKERRVHQLYDEWCEKIGARYHQPTQATYLQFADLVSEWENTPGKGLPLSYKEWIAQQGETLRQNRAIEKAETRRTEMPYSVVDQPGEDAPAWEKEHYQRYRYELAHPVRAFFSRCRETLSAFWGNDKNIA